MTKVKFVQVFVVDRLIYALDSKGAIWKKAQHGVWESIESPNVDNLTDAEIEERRQFNNEKAAERIAKKKQP